MNIYCSWKYVNTENYDIIKAAVSVFDHQGADAGRANNKLTAVIF